jgi:hypothetical protein
MYLKNGALLPLLHALDLRGDLSPSPDRRIPRPFQGQTPRGAVSKALAREVQRKISGK